MDKPRIVFYGTPALCLPILESLAKNGYRPGLVITAPDRPVGRKQVITPTPVKSWAQNAGVPVLQPEKLDNEAWQQIQDFQPDLAIVVAYGLIIPERFINLPTHGTLNIHYSLLPRWRGASPVEQTILHGDTKSGVSIQQMVFELDAGPIVAETTVEMTGNETTPELKDTFSEIGAQLLVETLPAYLQGDIEPRPQDETLVTKCWRIKKADGEVRLDMEPLELWRRYRGYYGWPGIFYFDNGQRIKITEANYDSEADIFTITKITPAGENEQSAQIIVKK